jgi:hypothetical protein
VGTGYRVGHCGMKFRNCNRAYVKVYTLLKDDLRCTALRYSLVKGGRGKMRESHSRLSVQPQGWSLRQTYRKDGNFILAIKGGGGAP